MPDVKKRIERKLLQYLRMRIEQNAPLVREIGVHHQHEGTRHALQEHSTGRMVEGEMKRLEASFTVPLNVDFGLRDKAVFRALDQVAEDMARQQSSMLFAVVTEATESTGNVVHAGGKPFHPSMFHEALRKMWIDFDESGQPMLPTMVLHPDMLKAIAPKMAEWERDEKLQAEYREVIALKRREWRDRESRRKLVD